MTGHINWRFLLPGGRRDTGNVEGVLVTAVGLRAAVSPEDWKCSDGCFSRNRLRRSSSTLLAMILAANICALGGEKTTVRLPPRKASSAGSGVASWYGHPYHGRQAANGSIYDMYELTAAHRTLPFGTRIRVHNLENGRTVEVSITDRGPFVDERLIDVSLAAANILGMTDTGVARVWLEVLSIPIRRLIREDPAVKIAFSRTVAD